jgi:hypothetical protein
MSKIFIPLFAFLFFSKMLVAQMDTVPPVVVCHTQTYIPINFDCQITIWDSDLFVSIDDEDSMNIKTGVRKICTGSGFPEDKHFVVFDAGEIGLRYLEVWAKDGAGNTSSCQVTIGVGDNGFCDPGTLINFSTPENIGIGKVKTRIQGAHCSYDSVDVQIPDSFGMWMSLSPGHWMRYGRVAQSGHNLTVTPSKNINPLNGVSTYDLLLISKHILNIEPLDSPWKIIAADANQDGKVTTADIITLRKLILGITTELPNGKSWRFLPYDYTFPNPLNPFQPAFPERIESPNTADPAPSYFAFKGVKIGDVDFSADPSQ